MSLAPITSADLDWILEKAEKDLRSFRGARIFFTGATGWIGKWVLAALVHADSRMGLGLKIVGLSRDPERFCDLAPQWGRAPGVSWIRGDLHTFSLSGASVQTGVGAATQSAAFDHVFHAAADLSIAQLSGEEVYRQQTLGMDHFLNELRAHPPQSILFTSSGAVYVPADDSVSKNEFLRKNESTKKDVQSFQEDAPLRTEFKDSRSAYGAAKVYCEKALIQFQKEHGSHAKIARCFAMTGAYLPLDGSYAMGNFIRDAAAGGPVQVAGDGTAFRSYLHMAEAVVWLLRIWAQGRSGQAYNLGSDEALSIREIAERVAREFQCQVKVACKPVQGAKVDYYIPSIERAQRELGLSVEWDFDESLRRTILSSND